MIKLIVFDMDGTLYDLNDVVAQNYEMQIAFLMQHWNKTREEIVTYFYDNCIYPEVRKDSKSATELFLRNGFKREEWNLFRESHFSPLCINKANATTPAVLDRFKDTCKLVLLSSNSYANVTSILNYLNIDANIFDMVMCSDRFTDGRPFNKKDAFCVISETYELEFHEILSIGDRYTTDILPLLELGGKGVHVKNAMSLEKLSKQIGQPLCSTSEYDYYNSLL